MKQAAEPGQRGSDSIHRALAVPYYAQLADILRRHISEGDLGPGAALPSEGELCATYGLSRTVVRQALEELVAEGMVVKERGRGTFVAKPKIADIVVQELRGFMDEMSERGHIVGTTVLSQSIIPAVPLVAAELGVAPHEDVVHIARIRHVNDEPIVKVDSWLPARRFPGLVDADLERNSLYDVLRTRYGVEANGGRRRIEATVANRALADVLGVEIGSPMLHLVATTLDRDGTPFESFSAFYRGDRTNFEIHDNGPVTRAGTRRPE